MKKIVIVGAGVAGINAATKLIDNGYPGELITIIDKGNDPHNRLPEEVMTSMLGAGGWSDGKLDWVEVDFGKSFVSNGKVQTVRRIPNIYTRIYFDNP